MRKILSLNTKWAFAKTAEIPSQPPENWYWVNLPHTWNSIDGQDGGNDYYRGVGCYARILSRSDLPEADRYYLELKGANSSADIYLNGVHLAHHDGGYSTWRVEITDYLRWENLLVVRVDNSPNEQIYPQMADFTFYGGLYREVNILCVIDSHFDLEYYGGPGLKITLEMTGTDAKVVFEVFLTNFKPGQKVRYTILDQAQSVVAEVVSSQTRVTLDIPNVHRWHGRKDPYLYSASAELLEGEAVLDQVSTAFGCRTYEIDPDRGFILNGEVYPLHGVCLGVQTCPEHFFYFDVPNTGETHLTAVAGEQKDESFIRKVAVFNEDYRLKETGEVLLWCNVTAPGGYFSLNDKLKDVLAVPEGKQLFESVVSGFATEAERKTAGMFMDPSMMQVVGSYTLLRITAAMETAGAVLAKDQLIRLNTRLNHIRKS
ncbi:MAG: glycoside hydrolase family 2 protein [Candidatus Onthomonas sp.]